MLLKFQRPGSPPQGDATSTAANAPSSPEQITQALRAGMCPPDSAFDYHLDDGVRPLASQHWTPLAVAMRAAQWFDECDIRTVVDIGSGAGKFCVAAALSGHCHFTGIEHRAHLVTSAWAVARTFKVQDRVYFMHGALGQLRMPAADAYYFYNPFEENVMGPGDRIDAEVELSAERHARDLEAVHSLLMAARSGTYVLTYNGIGATLPLTYVRVRVDRELPNVLCLWRKLQRAGTRRAHSPTSPGAGAGAA